MLSDINFPMLEYTNGELEEVVHIMWGYLLPEGLESIKIDKSKMRHLISDIQLNYNTIPYHFFTHGFNLAQMIFTMS